MTDKRQEIEELFSMFHDFEITLLTYQQSSIGMTIIIPWGQMWDDLDYQIKLELTGCNFLNCIYSEFISAKGNEGNDFHNKESCDKQTSEPDLISKLALEVQSHEYFPPNKYEFKCNSSKNYGGGELTFTADNYRIFDQDGKEITLEKMKQWATEWWDGIQKMWDDQK